MRPQFAHFILLFGAVAALAVSPARAQSAADGARAMLAEQAAAWNRGDLEGALKTYWPDERITWVHHGGVTHGFATFAEGIRAQFAEPGTMGHYSFEVLDAREINPDAALIVLRWSILAANAQELGGVSTQLWQRRLGVWEVTFEHASD